MGDPPGIPRGIPRGIPPGDPQGDPAPPSRQRLISGASSKGNLELHNLAPPCPRWVWFGSGGASIKLSVPSFGKRRFFVRVGFNCFWLGGNSPLPPHTLRWADEVRIVLPKLLNIRHAWRREPKIIILRGATFLFNLTKTHPRGCT